MLPAERSSARIENPNWIRRLQLTVHRKIGGCRKCRIFLRASPRPRSAPAMDCGSPPCGRSGARRSLRSRPPPGASVSKRSIRGGRSRPIRRSRGGTRPGTARSRRGATASSPAGPPTASGTTRSIRWSWAGSRGSSAFLSSWPASAFRFFAFSRRFSSSASTSVSGQGGRPSCLELRACSSSRRASTSRPPIPSPCLF